MTAKLIMQKLRGRGLGVPAPPQQVCGICGCVITDIVLPSTSKYLCPVGCTCAQADASGLRNFPEPVHHHALPRCIMVASDALER